MLGLGVRRSAIQRRVRGGRLHTLWPGVYAVGHRALAPDAHLLAAILATGHEAVGSDRTAADLWGMRRYSGRTVDVTVERCLRSTGGRKVHRRQVPEDERASVDGIPVTAPSRTVLDLAATHDKRALERMLAEAELRRLTDRVSLPLLLERYPQRPGRSKIVEILAAASFADGLTRSDLEDQLLRLVDGAGLPRPRINANVDVGDRLIEVDCSWPAARLAVELDGRSTYARAAAFDNDRERDRKLLVAGWQVIRVTDRHLREGRGALTTDLRGLLAAGDQAAESAAARALASSAREEIPSLR